MKPRNENVQVSFFNFKLGLKFNPQLIQTQKRKF